MKSRLGVFRILEPLREALTARTVAHIEHPESWGHNVKRYDSRRADGSAKYLVEWRRGSKEFVTDIIRLPVDAERRDA